MWKGWGEGDLDLYNIGTRFSDKSYTDFNIPSRKMWLIWFRRETACLQPLTYWPEILHAQIMFFFTWCCIGQESKLPLVKCRKVEILTPALINEQVRERGKYQPEIFCSHGRATAGFKAEKLCSDILPNCDQCRESILQLPWQWMMWAVGRARLLLAHHLCHHLCQRSDKMVPLDCPQFGRMSN